MKKFFTIFVLLSLFGLSSVFSQIPTDSLKAWYPFNGNANDESGNVNNGTVNGATLTSDRFGNENSAYSFDGTSNYIDFNNAFFNVGWLEYTVSLWFNSSDVNKSLQTVLNTYPHNGIGFVFNHDGSENRFAYFINSNPTVSTWDIFGQTNTGSSFNNFGSYLIDG